MKKLIPLLALFVSQLSHAYEDVPQGKASLYGTSKNVTCPIEVRPGLGISPIEINRSLLELEGLQMDIKTIQGTKTHMLIGKYNIGVDEQNKVRYVEAKTKFQHTFRDSLWPEKYAGTFNLFNLLC